MKKIGKILQRFKKLSLLNIVIAVSFAVNVSLIIFLANRSDFSAAKSEFEVGSIAEKDITADVDIKYPDKKAMSLLKYDIEKKIFPIFKVDMKITEKVLLSFSEFIEKMEGLISLKTSEDDFCFFAENLKRDDHLLDADFLINLSRNIAVKSILDMSLSSLSEVMKSGVISDTYKNTYGSDRTIEIWRWHENVREKEDINLSDILTLENLPGYIEANNIYSHDFTEKDKKTVETLICAFAAENIFFDYDETEKKRDILLKDIEPVYKTISAGDVIVKKGFLVSESDMEKIELLKNGKKHTDNENLAGMIIFLIVIYFFGIVIFLPEFCSFEMKKIFILMFIIFCEIFFLLFAFSPRIPLCFEKMKLILLIPTALFSMLLSIIVNILLGTAFSFISALVVFMFNMNNPIAVLFVFFTGISAAFIVRKFEKRIDLIRSGFYLGIMNFIYMFTFTLLFSHLGKETLFLSILALLNGIGCSILCLGILPIIEHIMNVPTKSRLSELADLNNPVLQKMLHMAPGTFNHSLLVGNLAETVCNDIGANGLLAKVGGYYHDIGKIDQAEFFIENQTTYNKHDNISPSLSMSIIKSHVKYGVEKARELNLPQAVIDIIAHHHGNGIIAYFYLKALKLESNEKISPEAYSYNDGKPKRKEEAVVLLADNVEAAVRALKSPTINDIKRQVDNVIKEKIETEQISESDLTFSDLQIIKKSFINMLIGIHHSRIQYPKQEEINELSANRDKAKEGARTSAGSCKKDKKNKNKKICP